jgi:hypothetical protein
MVTVSLCSCSEDSSPARPVQHPTLLVRPDGSGDVSTIQAAIDSLDDGGVIELDDGVFTGDGNRDLDFRGKAITLRSRSGDPDRSTIDCAADTLDPHRAFYFHSGEDSTSVLEAITISRGCAELGGAIACESSSSPSLLRCVFRYNAAGSGGAISCMRGSSPSFTACVFDSNRAEYYGGAVRARDSSPSFRDCVFEGGLAYIGAAFATDVGCYSRFTNCRFENQWGHLVGAVYCRFGDLILEDCLFLNNGARWYGAAVYFYFYSNSLINHCTFVGNHSTCGACVLANQGSVVTLAFCTLYANSGQSAAGVEADEGGVAIIRDTIIAGSTWGFAVCCRTEASRIYLQRCDLFGNDKGDWVGCAEPQLGHDGNVSADPLFCDPADRVFTLRRESPCRDKAEGEIPIGAWGVGCE